MSVSLAVPLPDVGRHFELERSFVRSIKPSNYVLSGLELAHGRPDLPPTIHLSTLRPGRLASCLQGLGYPLACRPARFALRGAGFVLTAVAAAVLIARLAIDTMMRAIASQLRISDAYGHTASVATIAAVLALLVGVVLLLWARLAE